MLNIAIITSKLMPEIEYEEKNLVKTKKGTLPILLTCPHNGTQFPVPKRTGSNLPAECPRIITELDLFTSDITDGVAEKIFALTNEWPYVVKFDVHRECIDVNREKKCGCEVLKAKMYFDAYHSAIAQFAQEIRTNNTCHTLVLLFDIHGKDNDTSDISVGTRNKSTIQPIVKWNPGWGWDYKFGLISLLINKLYTISPGSPCQEDDPEFFGGYTVKEHGGWQFEIANSKRQPGDDQNRLIDSLGNIIHKFYKHNYI